MRRTRFDDWPCPIARAVDLVGDWWTPLVMREAFGGATRFEDFQRGLDVPRSVLAARLRRLTEEGLLTRVEYQAHPPRYEYRLTQKGREFYAVLAAMWRWGADWLWDDGRPPVMLVDRATGRRVEPVVVDRDTGETIDVRRLRLTAAQPVATGRSGSDDHPDHEPT